MFRNLSSGTGKITINTAELKDGVKTIWFDPSSGSQKFASGVKRTHGKVICQSTGRNTAGEAVWAVVMRYPG